MKNLTSTKVGGGGGGGGGSLVQFDSFDENLGTLVL